jgi:hypothetical protein
LKHSFVCTGQELQVEFLTSHLRFVLKKGPRFRAAVPILREFEFRWFPHVDGGRKGLVETRWGRLVSTKVVHSHARMGLKGRKVGGAGVGVGGENGRGRMRGGERAMLERCPRRSEGGWSLCRRRNWGRSPGRVPRGVVGVDVLEVRMCAHEIGTRGRRIAGWRLFGGNGAPVITEVVAECRIYSRWGLTAVGRLVPGRAGHSWL